MTERRTISSTDDYNIFKYLPENRKVEESHVKRLMSSMRKRNLLHQFPVFVDTRNYVMDGQHRIEAAKRLGLTVYYQVVDNDDNYIVTVNSTQLPWKLYDYVNFHAEKGYSFYITLRDFLDTYGFSVTVTTLILSMADNRTEKIKNGLFSFNTDIEYTHSIFRLLSDLAQKNPVMKGSRFARTFVYLHNKDIIDIEELLKRLIESVGTLKIKGIPHNKKDAIRALEDAYNYKKRGQAIRFY